MSSESNLFATWRLVVVMCLLVCACFILGRRLWNVQVKTSASFSGEQQRQSYRRVQLPGIRGQIFDRKGRCLAENRPSYCIALYAEELRKSGGWQKTIDAVNDQIDALALALGLPRTISKQAVGKHIMRSLPMPVIAWRDVDFQTVAMLSEQSDAWTGVEVIVLPERHYPYGALAAHVLGYVGSDAPLVRDTEEKWHYYLPELRGRSGLEAYYDTFLNGVSGEEILRVDARGYCHDRWLKEQAQKGKDLTLTLDVAFQQTLEKALAGKHGAGVMLDPRNGDVLALASTPGFDLNELVPRISKDTWERLSNDPDKVMFNRAVQGIYPPGSVFKPFTALAALEKGTPTDELYDCTGVYREAGLKLRCWNRYGHGKETLTQALMDSCNPYFCDLAVRTGIDALSTSGSQAGFGSKTGIDLPAETAGLMPSPEWLQRTKHATWTKADTAQLAIGQGFMVASPLQVAHAVATLANGGKQMRPRLVRIGAAEGELQRQVPWAPKDIETVTDGMVMVVESGTGRRMQIEGVEVAGKTGSAEYMDGAVRRKQTWSAAFAPARAAEVVVVVLVENGQSGGVTAAPLVQTMLASYFGAQARTSHVAEERLGD